MSAPLPITISQDGEPDLRFTAHWATRPTYETPYYAVRIGFWKNRRGWRVDLTHHKLYLTNNPADIERFQITNGFNLFTLSRAFRRKHLTYSLGAGPVITYPVNTVRGKRADEERGVLGYLLSGATVVGMATREVPLTGALALSLDARGSLSYARVPVADGHAKLPNAALHLHFGLGYLFGRKP